MATYLLEKDERPLSWRLCAGAALGLTVLGLVGYVLASVFGLTGGMVAAAGLLATSPLGLLVGGAARARLRAEARAARAALRDARATPTARVVVTALVYVAAALAAVRLADRAVFVRPEGIFVGVEHNLGDLPFHLAVTQGFTEGGRFPPEHPELAGTRLAYPFLADFVSAMLVRAGMGLRAALFWPTAILLIALFGLVHRFGSRLSGDARAGLLTPAVFFLAGGLGFALLAREADPRAGGLLGLLRHLPHDYTILFSGGLRWGNVVTTMLLPQRSILLGLPLATLALTLVWDGLSAPGRRRWVAAGVLCGLMPLAHAHSVPVTVAIGVAAALLCGRVRDGLAFAGTALLLAAPQARWMLEGAALQPSSFVGWHVGWDRREMSVAGFWLLNAGVYLPLIAAALVVSTNRRQRLFYVPFALCFVVPNLLRLSPWIWDNLKYMVFWHLGSAPLVALLLVRMMEGGRWRRRLGAGALAILTASGGLDLWRVLSGSIAVRVFDREQIGFARALAAAAGRDSLLVHAPTYNAPALLSGRRSLLGYPGHIWSQGLASGRRGDDIETFYEGGPPAEAVAARYGIDYAVLGPQEREGLSPDEEWLHGYPVVAAHGAHRLLRIRR
jgi:hypothetical protein